jgi:hypothetical protein
MATSGVGAGAGSPSASTTSMAVALAVCGAGIEPLAVGGTGSASMGAAPSSALPRPFATTDPAAPTDAIVLEPLAAGRGGGSGARLRECGVDGRDERVTKWGGTDT